MIPSETKNLFQNIVTHEMFEMDRMLERVHGASISNMASPGLAQSGNMMQLLTDNATNSLKSRAQFILGQLLRCLAACHVPLDTETVAEALGLLRHAIQTEASNVGARLFQYPVFVSASFELAKRQLQDQYAQEGPRLISRLSTELELAAKASQGSSSQSAPSFTFHGPVGLVQTGDGSQATVHQHVNANVRNEVASALQLFLEQLDKSESNSIGNRADLQELIVEAKAEAEKPECNNLKLGSSLRTIAETTKFVGSLAACRT